MPKYYMKTDGEYRLVVRVESETDTEVTITNPLFNCFGSKFNSFGRKRTITKAGFKRQKWNKMPKELVARYETIKKGQDASYLYGEDE